MSETHDGGSDFDDAFRDFLPRAVRVAYRILGDVDDAEDAAVEALARAAVRWRRVGALDYREAWVLRVTANVAVDVARRRRRSLPAAALVEPVQPTHEDLVVLQLALATALAKLSRRQREVVTLRYLAGMTDVDVARCLHVSIGTVKRHGGRALEGLRAQLGADWEVAQDAG
ncbi:MAG TPA: sigma-70 family RNA polymerase sigma factor [Acidimicrobiales bacterium]